MLRLLPRFLFVGIIATTLAAGRPCFGQPTAKPNVQQPGEQALENGFQVRLLPAATIKEMQQQDQLFELEVEFKSMRFRWVNTTDAKTGEKKRELIWYLVYKVVNRPLDRPTDTTKLKPVNNHDPLPSPAFIPRFTLMTQRSANGATRTYQDMILKDALQIINKRESRYAGQPALKHNVAISGPVPTVTPKNAKKDNAVYGVAMWRGVDPKTDFLTVAASGFSNAYLEKGGLTYRKVIMMKFKRPGDEFFQSEGEFERIDADDRSDSKTYYPRWVYVPDDVAAAKKKAAKQP